MAPVESQKAIFALIHGTIVERGSGNWSDEGPSAARYCGLASGQTGAHYSCFTMGPASVGPDADIAKVEAFWKSKHLRTNIRRSSNPKDTTIRLYGYGGQLTQ